MRAAPFLNLARVKGSWGQLWRYRHSKHADGYTAQQARGQMHTAAGDVDRETKYDDRLHTVYPWQTLGSCCVCLIVCIID